MLSTTEMVAAISMVVSRVRNDDDTLSSVSSVQKRSTMPVRMIIGKSEMYFVAGKSW